MIYNYSYCNAGKFYNAITIQSFNLLLMCKNHKPRMQ